MSEEEQVSPVLTIQKSAQRTVSRLKVLGRGGGLAILSAAFYLLYWKDSSIRQQYETLFWWLTLLGGAAMLWWSEYSQLRSAPAQHARQHLKIIGKIAGLIITSVLIDWVLLKDNPMADDIEVYAKWLILLAAGFAIWALIQDWLITKDRMFIFDSNHRVFRVVENERDLFHLPFQAIKRIKIQESSNVFPIYRLFIHLKDKRAYEIDASAQPEEIMALANQLSAMTGVKVVVQGYNDPLTKEEKEEQRLNPFDVYKGD